MDYQNLGTQRVTMCDWVLSPLRRNYILWLPHKGGMDSLPIMGGM